MSRPTSTRRRLSLLASSSLAVASLMAGVGGVVALAPSQALAANECGDPSANAGGDDVLICNGAYPTGIDYTATTDGNLVLLLVDTVTVPDGGVRLTGAAGEGLGVSTVTGIVDGGDINITNIGGIGIDLSGTAANVSVNITEADAGDGTPFVSGTSGGIRLRTTAGFDGELNIEAGTVDGGAGWGLSNVVTGGGEASIDYGATSVNGTEGVRAISATGTASVTGTGTVSTTGAGYGVFVGGGAGGATADISGTVTAADIGVRVQATGGGTATATVGDITAVGVGLEISAINGGDATVVSTGNVSGSTGISAVGNAVVGGNVSVTTGGTVTGTAGDGITATSAWDGNTTIDASAGLVTATGNGVSVTTFDGDGDITVGDVNAGQYGVVGSVTGDGNMTVTVTGAVVGGTVADFDGVDIDTGTGIATFTLAAGASVDTQGATAFGVDIDTQGGNIIATIDGDILGGGLGANVNAGAGTVSVTGGGAIDGGAYQAIVAATVDGDLTVNVTGALTGAEGVEGDVTGTGNANITVGAITATGDGIDLSVNSGTATVTTNGAIVAGGTGVIAGAGGNVVVNVNDDVTATVTGINASSSAGSSTVIVAAGVTIDPEDYGIVNVAATESIVTTGDSVTILVDNSTDNDAIAQGVHAESTAAADGVDPSVQVSLGTSNTISLMAGGITDGGAGISATNTGGGTGSVSVETGDGLILDLQGDNAIGVFASTNTGAIDIDVGTGRVWLYSGDGADSAGNFTVSAGIRGQSSGGNITIDSNANVQAASAGAIEGLGIYATTSGAGTVDITTGASSYTWGQSYGIGVNAGDGAVTIVTNGMVESEDGEAIFVNGGAGTITVTNNAAVDSSSAAGIELDGSGDITVNANANVNGTTAIDVSGDSGVVTVTVNTGVTVTGEAGAGIDASTNTGAINVDVDGNVSATATGVLATSVSGNLDVDTAVGTTVAGGTGGISATTGGVGTINIDTNGSVSGGAGAGIAAAGGTGTVTVNTFADVSGTAGIDAGGGGVVNVTSSGGTITATAGSGIVTSAGAATTVNNSDAINATGGVGISAAAANAVSVNNSGAIAGTAVHGIVGSSSGATAAGVFIDNTGAVGSSVNGVDGFGVVGVISNAASTGNITVLNNASVYSDTHGVGAQSFGLGNVTVNVGTATAGTTRGASGYGVFGITTNAASTGTVEINVGANSVIEAGVGGVYAANAGTGASTITIGDNVSIDPDDFGVQASGAGEQNIVLGNNVVVDINNTDGDATAVGLWASSTAAADVAVGDPTVEITAGTGLVITVDDGAGAEADGGAGILAQTVGTASSQITVGDGLSITMVGDSSVGVGAISDDGDIEIDIGTGTISVTGGNGVDSAGNYPGSAGIGAISDGGSIDIVSNATIILTNGPGLDASGIHGSTTGAGSVTITSGGTISSSDVGINGESVDGAVLINQNAAVTATNVGVQAESTGTGTVTVASTASVTSTAFDGISAVGDTGAVTVTTVAGTTITSGDDGISAIITDGAAAADVTVTNNAAINANQSSGGGYGIYAWNNGTGDTIVGNNGALGGSAVYGIVAGANTGTVDIDNAGTIGSAGNPVAQDGIYGYVAGGAGDVSITNLATGVIWAEDQGIYGFAGGTGGVGISNAAAIGGSANNGIFGQAAVGSVVVINAGAIGSNGDNVAGDGIYAEVLGGAGGVFVQNINAAIWADGSGIVADADGSGTMTVINSGVVNAGASGISADANGGVSTVTNSAAITAGNDGIQSFNTGTGTITVTNSAAITAASDGIDTSGDDGATIITNSAAISAGDTGIEADNDTGAITVTNNAGGTITATGDGIRASANGGAVTVTTNATVSGGADGVETNNTGAAVSTVNVNANVTSSGAGNAGILASTTGNGLVDVNVANNVVVASTAGSAVRTSSNGGTVAVDLGTGGVGALATTVRGLGTGANSWVVDLNNAAGGTTTLNIASNTTVRSNDNTVGGYDDLAIRGIGGSVVVNNAGRLNGRVNFAGLTGNVVFNNTSGLSWHTTGASVFSGGADVLNNSATGVIFTNAGGVATSFDFGAGADTFTQAGLLVVGEPAQGAATLTITNLEAWNNSGSIAFGSSATTLAGAASDGFANDKIDMGSGTFTGSGNSRLFMDANLGAVTQTDCSVALTAADCFDLTGASTAGSTTIRFNDISGNAFGAFNPTGIVVVDVTGAGATAAGNFSLLAGQPLWRADPNSADGVLDKGLFFYDLTLDGKQHKLVGLPDGEAFEFTTMGQAAQAAWYTTTGTWFDRQADLRDQLDDSEAGAGVWMKITGSAADRDLISSYELFGVTYNFDTSYDQQTISVIGGIDFVGASSADGQWVIGGMAGYVDSDVNFDASPTTASMEGLVIGVYGTFVNKGWFVDGVIAGNLMDLDYQAPTLAPAPGNIFAGQVDSWGGQAEGGYSFALGGTGFFEPLVSLSYVRTEIDALTVPGAVINWDDQTSLRGSLGARIGGTAAMDTFDAKFSVTGRIWNEFEGENELIIDSAGPDLGLTDDFSGSFGEISGSINLFSNKAAFSAFLNAGVKFKDDYQSTDATLGFRWRW